MDKGLFRDSNGKWVSGFDIVKCLEQIKAYDCDILFIHSALSFGIPDLDLSRKDLMKGVFAAIEKLGVGTVCFPTFTFSFCNDRDYDLINSKSKMGSLNEYVRKLPQAIRSIDPLMSVVLVGEKDYLVKNIGHNSVGKDSTFDLLHKEPKVKFLFLGVRPADCFTYTHYIEERLNVPYRYNKRFTGKIITPDKEYVDTYNLFVRYEDVMPTTRDDFEQYLIKNQIMHKVGCGDSAIYCVDEKVAYDALCMKIDQDINYMLAKPYPIDLKKNFVLSNEMVAL